METVKEADLGPVANDGDVLFGVVMGEEAFGDTFGRGFRDGEGVHCGGGVGCGNGGDEGAYQRAVAFNRNDQDARNKREAKQGNAPTCPRVLKRLGGTLERGHVKVEQKRWGEDEDARSKDEHGGES